MALVLSLLTTLWRGPSKDTLTINMRFVLQCLTFKTGSAPYCIDIDGAGVLAADQLSLWIVAAPILSTSCMPPFLHTCLWVKKRIILALGGKSISQLAGFEPTRAEPIGFQVQRLNHSATTARVRLTCKFGNLENIWHSLAFKAHLCKLMFC